ncbi:MAG TPA: DUF2098 domain-containing protein [Methanobacterium sp.]
MEVADARGKNILKGSHVRYTGTGSAGEVLDIKTDDEGSWAKIDTTNLWYNSEFLELINQREYERIELRGKQFKEKVDKEDRIQTKEDNIEKAAKLKKQLEDVDMSSELCDGGG